MQNCAIQFLQLPQGILNLPICVIIMILYWIGFNTAVKLWFQSRGLKHEIKTRQAVKNFHMASNRQQAVSTARSLTK